MPTKFLHWTVLQPSALQVDSQISFCTTPKFLPEDQNGKNAQDPKKEVLMTFLCLFNCTNTSCALHWNSENCLNAHKPAVNIGISTGVEVREDLDFKEHQVVSYFEKRQGPFVRGSHVKYLIHMSQQLNYGTRPDLIHTNFINRNGVTASILYKACFSIQHRTDLNGA